MTPCSPRSWSDQRILIGVGTLTLAAMLMGVVFGHLSVVVIFVAVVVLAELATVTTRRWMSSRGGDLELSISPVGRQEASLTGMTYRVTAAITPARDLRSALVIPIVPHGFSAVGMSGARGTLRARRTTVVSFDLQARQPGVSVFPGVLVRVPSPLRLFSRPIMFVDRTTITILPNYRSDSHPLLARFMKPLQEALASRRRVVRGHGTDFRELREYHPSDPMNRVDWKATARRNKLMVREFEEPREYSISVVLDASVDMTHETTGRAGFANGAEFIARLGFVALTQGFGVRLTTYDEFGIRHHRMKGGPTGFIRLLSELVAIPRASALRVIDRGDPALLTQFADRTWEWAVRRLGGNYVGRSRNAFMKRYFGDEKLVESRAAAMVADFRSEVALNTPHRCRRCRRRVFADEVECKRCGLVHARGAMPDRAAAAVEALFRSTSATRGREMLVFISALQGGEVRAGVLPALELAARGHRTVHVLLPTHAELANARPDAPGSLGHSPPRRHLVGNLERLRRAGEFAVFRSALLASGTQVHAIDDREELEEIVAELLLAEVLAS